MDKVPTYSRPSKLKRRRKNQTTAITQQAQSQIAAAIFSPSRSSRKRNSLNSARPNQKRENNDTTDVDELIDDVIVLPKVSDFLNIPKIGLTPMTVAAMTDYEISSSIENRSQQTKKVKSSNSKEDEAVYHKILGTVDIKSNLKSNNYICPFALPASYSHSIVDTNKREGNNAEFFRGDGQSVEEEILNVSWKAHDVTIGKFIKITSRNGATIRSKFDIDDNCTHLDAENEGEDSVVIGKLKVGDIRPVLQSKWLDPPLEEANGDNNVGDDEFEDDELVGVMRYQIQLLECDLSSQNESEKSFNSRKGWISDRSRLKDEPFTICKVIESNK